MLWDRERGVFDAVVIGAGPAGSATARWLALGGLRVALVERTRFESARIGESLAPQVQEHLRGLGVWSEFLALSPLPSWGTSSVWGETAPREHSHLLSPYGSGWHVDRRAFDHMLAQAAVAAGASLFEGVAVNQSVYREGYWSLRTTSNPPLANGNSPALCARVLIDATGRRAQIARALGGQHILFDRLVAVASRFAGIDATEQGHLVVEAAREGWWYSAPLPNGARQDDNAMIAMLMTDADLCRRLRFNHDEIWQALLQSTELTQRRVASAQRVSKSQVHCAHSQRLRRDHASNAGPWLAVGDAALSVDPISGSGVLRALRTGRSAANAVSALLARPSHCQPTLAAYEAEHDEECTKYLLERAQYYASEQRFATPFWRRRHVMRQSVSNDAGRVSAGAVT
jgi:flavin-dependent dehydrogenase